MGKPYAQEMSKLNSTFSWAMDSDIASLRAAIRASSNMPLLAVGSGGSLSACHALVEIHKRWTGQLASVVTPLELAFDPLGSDMAAWLLSASGRNVDILAALRTLGSREVRQLTLLCGRKGSPLAKTAQSYRYADLIEAELPAGKDGFLATNSLLAFTALIARAYLEEFAEQRLKPFVASVANLLSDDKIQNDWKAETDAVWTRNVSLVLYGPSTKIGAVDLESKFVEAAISSIQIADYRNFAHGRHHWLAKRSEESGIIAFISEQDRLLAEKTLALVPSNIPIARINIPGAEEVALVVSLLAALWITGWAGPTREIDPGQPIVPDFGRKLYHLAIPKSPKVNNDKISHFIVRKVNHRRASPIQMGNYDFWKSQLKEFVKKLNKARFGGVVFDYDGTLVDTRERFECPKEEIVGHLIRLVEAGVKIGIATGRGDSIGKDLRSCLPKLLWPHILIGYYNGGEIATLDDEDSPSSSSEPCAELQKIAQELRCNPELVHIAKQKDRQLQITLQSTRQIPENQLWDITNEVIKGVKATNISVTRSSHSIDILPIATCKTSVVRALQGRLVPGLEILKIGDRGRWPGNDYSLLSEPFSLSVDEVSFEPATCWNLAPLGQRGIQAAMYYLNHLNAYDGVAKLDIQLGDA